MRTRLISIIILLLASCSVSQALSRKEIREIIANSPGVEAFPEASAIVLYRQQKVALTSDTHREMVEEVLFRIVSGKAKHEYGDIQRLMDSRYDSMELIKAETFGPDGSVIPIMEGADNVITLPDLVDAPMYDYLKQRVVSFSGVESGAVLHWIIRYQTRYSENERFWFGTHEFMGDIPVLRDKYHVQTHSDLPFQFVLFNGCKSPEITNKDEYRIFQWDTALLPVLTPEWGMAPKRDIVPRLEYSTAFSWENAVDRFRAAFEPSTLPTQKISDLVRGLTEGAESDWEKFRLIYQYIAQDVKSVPVKLGVRGYKPSEADAVIDAGYADSLDKAMLLCTMLRIAGFNAEPVVTVAENVQVSRDLASLGPFDQVAVVVTLENNDRIWLDTISEYSKLGTFLPAQGTLALRIGKTDFELVTVPVDPPESSRSILRYNLTMNQSGSAKGIVSWEGYGRYEVLARNLFSEKTQRERNNYLALALSDSRFTGDVVSFTEPEWKDTTKTASFECQVEFPSLGIPEGNVIVVSIPGFPFRFSRMFIPAGNTERVYAVELDGCGIEELDFSLTYPKGFALIYHPEADRITVPGLEIWQNFTSGDVTFRMKRLATWSEHRIEPELYKTVNHHHKRFKQREQNILLLERK